MATGFLGGCRIRPAESAVAMGSSCRLITNGGSFKTLLLKIADLANR